MIHSIVQIFGFIVRDQDAEKKWGIFPIVYRLPHDHAQRWYETEMTQLGKKISPYTTEEPIYLVGVYIATIYGEDWRPDEGVIVNEIDEKKIKSAKDKYNDILNRTSYHITGKVITMADDCGCCS